MTSLVVSLAVAVLALAGVAAVPLWLGWPGIAALGGLLAWFYWGPRPDLRPVDAPGGRTSRDDG